MATDSNKIEFNRWYLAAGAGLIVVALLLQPIWLGRLSADGALNPDNALCVDLPAYLAGAARPDRALLALPG